MLLGLNAGAGVLSEPWTNWNFLFFGFQILLLVCVFRRIYRLQQQVANWIAYLTRRFGHDA